MDLPVHGAAGFVSRGGRHRPERDRSARGTRWAIPRQFGLVCSMGYAGGGSIPDGLNVKANHDAIVANFERLIPKAAAARVPNVITFFGNRRGMRDDEAIATAWRAEPREASRRGQRRDDLRGAAEQQGQSQGLSGRSHGVRRGGHARRSTRRA